jgi:integrase
MNRRGFGYVRRLPSKRYQASYAGPDLQRHLAPVTFTTKGDAEAWLAEERKEVESGKWRPPAVRKAEVLRASQAETLSEYATRWLTQRRVKGEPLRPNTVIDYRRALRLYITPHFGDRPVTDITRADIRDWHGNVLRSVSDRPRAKAYAVLRTIMNSAVEDELIDVNPVAIRGAGVARRKRGIEPASLHELATIVEAMPERLRLMVLLATWCALRYGELAELRRRDIDLTNEVIKVRRAVTFTPGAPMVGPPKTDAGVRDVAIPPHLMEAVRAHLKDHTKPGRDALLFPADLGGHLHESVVYRYWNKARKAAGRPDLRFHDLRHTGATFAAQAGATTAELQSRLGHTTADAAMIYQHAAKGRDRQLAQQLSKLAEK